MLRINNGNNSDEAPPPDFTCSEGFPVCPGLEEGEFCDGGGDCGGPFCGCAAALKFCLKGAINPCSPEDAHSEERCYNGLPVCAGKADAQYCDGEGDCKNSFCDCDTAVTFCDTDVNPCA